MTKNTKGLLEYQEKRSKAKEKSVLDAIEYLKEKNEVVSFQAVSNRAKVTRGYLYNHKAIREIIENARPGSIKAHNHKVITMNPKLVSLESKHEALARRYKRVLAENKELKDEINTLRSYIESQVYS